MGSKRRKFSISISNFFGFGGNKDDSKSKQLATKSATFTAASAAQVDAFRKDTKVQQRVTTRPLSVMQLSQQSSESQIGKDSLRNLDPTFTHINSTSTKLYREGYFHVLDDLAVDGRPISNDRTWKVCFARLTGTNLSLWDTVELEAAGEQPVTPRYLNLTDSSMKVKKDLPARDGRGIPAQNILSISTAGKNRFLFNFESFHDMAQWTAAIKLAKFENASVPYSQPPPPRPRSRGGKAAFTPNGLVSQTQDMSSHLSAREQEFLAKQTGSTLLQINTVKQPPHQTGLLGLLETREAERERMKRATWNGGVDPTSLNNATLNQALAQRVGMRQEQERQTLIQERERMVQQNLLAQQQQRQSMMSQQDLFARGGTPGPVADPRQSYQDRSRTPSSQTLLGGRVSSPEPMVQYSHQSTYQPQHVTQYQQYHQAQQRRSIYGAPNTRQSMLPDQYQAAMEQQTQMQIQQHQLQISQMQQQLLQQQMQQQQQQQAAAAPVMPMRNQMVNMSNQQVGYQPAYPAQTPQTYGYLPPQSPPPQQYSQYGGR